MIRQCIATITIVSVSLLGFTATHAQESFAIQYRFEKGRAYCFADSITVNSTTEMMGQEMKSTSTVFSVTRAVPTEIRNDGSTVFVVSSDTMNVAIKSNRGDTTLVPREMIGKRTRLTLSRLGDASKRETIDTIKLAGAMRGVGQRETLRFHVFSPKPVTLGEKWTSTRFDTSDAMGGKMVVVSSMEYCLLAKEKKDGKECVKIGYTGKMTVTGKGSMMGMDLYIEGSGTSSGTTLVDPENGISLSEDSKSEMETTTAATGQQNMTIPSSQSITTHRVLLAK
jgi:hypothetical protein